MPVNDADSIHDLVVACVDELGSQRRFEVEARRQGHSVSRQTISNIVRGNHTGNFDEQTLAAIAAVARWPLARVHEVARQPMPTGEFKDQLPRDVDQLDQTSRQAVIDVINSMLRLQRSTDVRPGDEAAPDNVRELPKRGQHGGERAVARRRPKGEPRSEDPSS